MEKRALDLGIKTVGFQSITWDVSDAASCRGKSPWLALVDEIPSDGRPKRGSEPPPRC
jgi:hypothetical protein